MGLREKVALLILVDFFVQLMYGQCLPNTNKWISFQVPYKKYKVRKKALPVRRPVVREGCVARTFNFPEVEYGLAPTSTSSLYSNHNFDLNQQFSKPLPTPSKYSVPTTNEPENRNYKKKHKKNGTEDRTAKKISKTASAPDTCLKNELFFPSVDYPLDVTDLWGPNYWNRFPQMQPEPKLDVIDMTINTKPKKEKAKTAKASRKQSKINKILNSCKETKNETSTALPILNRNTKINQNTTDCVSQSKKLTGSVEIPINKENIIPTTTLVESIYHTSASLPVKNESEIFQDTNKSLISRDDFIPTTISCVLRDEKTKEIGDQRNIDQITPAPKVERPLTESTSTTSNIISFLTTVAPTLMNSNENTVCNIHLSLESLSNSTEVENNEDPQLPDEMGYTLMYPELFSSVSTSTMSPLDDSIDNSWMYPEFDNHTYNSYSDEIEQCYILVP